MSRPAAVAAAPVLLGGLAALLALAGAAVLLVGLAMPAGAELSASAVLAELAEQQRVLTAQMRQALLAMGEEPAAIWALIGGAFLYGVVHAAGPGHGKVVLTAYLATQPTALRRGVALAGAAALLQGTVAIVLVLGVVALADITAASVDGAARWLTRASFAAIMALGLYLMARSTRAGWRALRRTEGHAHAHGGGCGHAGAAGDAKGAVGTVLAIGLRPCSGALIVLVAAQVLGRPLAGVAAVLAMSLGTALAVGALALLTVSARHWAVRLAGRAPQRARLLSALGAGIGVAGGVVVLLAGTLMLAASFAPPHPLVPRP